MANDGEKLGIAFVAGLSDDKLRRKLAPLAAAPNVGRVDVFRRSPLPDAPEKVVCRPIPTALRAFEPAAELARVLDLLAKGGDYDVVVGCFQRWHGVWARLAGKTWKKPVVQLVITSVEWNLERPMCRHAMLSATACGVRGEASARALRGAGFAGPVEIVHNVFEGWRKPDGDGKGRGLDIVAAADYAEEKDYPWMLEVFSELKKRRPDFRAALCGAGIAERLSAETAERGLEDNVEFKGRLEGDPLVGTVASSRVFLSTSRTEGLPQAALEALSLGVPCVLTDVGDCRTVVGADGAGGTLVPHGDTAAMSAALDAALSADAPEAREKAGRRFAELAPEFSLENVARKWESLLAAALDTHSGSGGR